ncbi:YciI family protein [Streptomyces globisporus]|uniref:YciI family protein n=1 Tax=Streptomyces globisporus TaxID=1908 RepID=UPI0004CBCE29|nr:YciI family protein [Streptomyces globisporus]
MKYALVIFETDESRRRIRADRAAYRKEYEGWIGGLAAAGKLLGGEALETGHTAPATVRTTADGTSTVTDGPAQAGEETIGGWFIVEVADRAEALELARSLPTPETVEIRPVLESA